MNPWEVNKQTDIYERFTIPGIMLTLRIDGGITSIKLDNRLILMLEVIYLDIRCDGGGDLLNLPELFVKRVLTELRSLTRQLM